MLSGPLKNSNLNFNFNLTYHDLKQLLEKRELKEILLLSKQYYKRLKNGEEASSILSELEEMEFIYTYNINLTEDSKIPCSFNTKEDIKKHRIALLYAYHKIDNHQKKKSIVKHFSQK